MLANLANLRCTVSQATKSSRFKVDFGFVERSCSSTWELSKAVSVLSRDRQEYAPLDAGQGRYSRAEDLAKNRHRGSQLFFERKNVHQTTIKGPSDFGASDFHHTKFDSLMFSSLASTGRRFTSLTSHDCRYSHAHKRHSLFLCWLLTKSNVV